MSESRLFGGNIALLDKVLDLRVKNHQIISSNIANADTPGYRRAEFRFEQELQTALAQGDMPMKKTDPEHLPLQSGRFESVQGTVYQPRSQYKIGDGNNVQVDQEMVKLSENQIRYEAAIRMISDSFSSLKYVIQGGK